MTNISDSTEKPALVFEEFFETGLEEHASPFLTPESRKWAINLPLKAALLAGLLLFIAFIFSWSPALSPLAGALLLFVYFFAGIPSLIESIEDLASLQINIDVLMTLAAFGSVLIGSPMEGALLLVLFSISGAMEDAVTAKAKNTISNLHKLSPTIAYVLNDQGYTIQRSLKEISIGTKILIKSGEVVPLDGIVVEGTSSVNLVHLTGENLPITKKPHDTVQAGARNLEGALVLQVTHTSSDSTLTRIIRLVTQAQEAKPKLQRWFDRLSRSYAISIILAAFAFALSLPFILQIPFFGQEGSIYRSLAFLIAASPCALIIAIPIAYLSAVSSCATQGILLKGGVTLDALASCSTIAFDKTGTLTSGELICLGFEPFNRSSEEQDKQALAIALAMEQKALHPIAKAISLFVIEKRIIPYPLDFFESIPGYGLKAKLMHQGEKTSAYLGNIELIQEKISDENKRLLFIEKTEAIKKRGELVAALLIGEDIYLFRFQDALRPNVKTTLDQLKASGYKILMLSGDHELSARRIAEQMGIDNYQADLRPEDKLRIISDLSKKDHLIMVGDGVNDAPALARATVGISMGKVGSSAAIDAADVVLLHDSIDKLGWLMEKAKATQQIVRENLAIATLAIFVASIPALLGFVPLWLAVLLHEGGTVIVGLNGLRLLKK